jgi:hypothetical protein
MTFGLAKFYSGGRTFSYARDAERPEWRSTRSMGRGFLSKNNFRKKRAVTKEAFSRALRKFSNSYPRLFPRDIAFSWHSSHSKLEIPEKYAVFLVEFFPNPNRICRLSLFGEGTGDTGSELLKIAMGD